MPSTVTESIQDELSAGPQNGDASKSIFEIGLVYHLAKNWGGGAYEGKPTYLDKQIASDGLYFAEKKDDFPNRLIIVLRNSRALHIYELSTTTKLGQGKEVILVRLYLLLLVCWLSSGCASSFSERHYFKSVDAQGTPINYYRLNVEGNTFLASSRYLFGYFDENALDAYFSEITQPEKALFSKTVTSDGGNIQPLSESLKGKKLILLLSSNSDSIAEQIGQFANNQEIMSDLTRLINCDRIRGTSGSGAELTKCAEAPAMIVGFSMFFFNLSHRCYSYPPYTNFSRGKCLTFNGTEGMGTPLRMQL